MTASQALVLDGRLPRAAAALQRARSQRVVAAPWRRAWQRLWLTPVLPCDRCGKPMLEHLPMGEERVCIRCVAAARMPLAEPELAGAVAVLRTLLSETDVEWRVQCKRPFVDGRRMEAALQTAEVVLRWITPPNQRTPDMAAIAARDVMDVIARYDRTWALRSGSVRSLAGIFRCWRERQVKAQRYFELEAVDRRYAALIAEETAQP